MQGCNVCSGWIGNKTSSSNKFAAICKFVNAQIMPKITIKPVP